MGQTAEIHGRRGSVVRAIVRSLATVFAVLIVGVALWPWSPRLSSLWTLTTSVGLMLWTFSKPWPLRWFSLVLPLALTASSYGLQMAFLRPVPLDGRLWAALAGGAALGLAKAAGHRVRRQGRYAVADRSVLVLGVWAVSYLLTQSAGLFGGWRLVEWGMAGGAFGAAAAAGFYLAMWYRYVRWQMVPGRNAVPANAAAPAAAMLLAGAAALAGTALPLLAQGQAVELLGNRAISSELTRSEQTPPPSLPEPVQRAGDAAGLGTYQGAPPVVPGSSRRYGRTVYQAGLNPRVIAALRARQGAWTPWSYFDRQGKSGVQYRLEGWELRGGRLVVDWDQMAASLEPIAITVTTLRRYTSSPPDTAKFVVSTTRITPETLYVVEQCQGDWVGIYGVASDRNEEASSTLNLSTGRRDRQGAPVGSGTRDLIHSIANAEPGSETLAIAAATLPSCGFALQLPQGQRTILFQPVQTMGVAPARPSLPDEVRAVRTGWTTDRLTGRTILVGQLTGIRPAPDDEVLSRRWLEDQANRRARGVQSGAEFMMSGPSLQQIVYQRADWGSRCVRTASAAEIEIDWDRRTAQLKGLVISGRVEYSASYTRNPRAAEVVEQFSPHAPGRVRFDHGGAASIAGGLQQISVDWRTLEAKGPLAPGEKPVWKEMSKQSVSPVTFRGQPVEAGWQAVALPEGRLLVRVHARSSAIRLYPDRMRNCHVLPAWYEFVFTPRSGTPLTPIIAARPPAPTAGTGEARPPAGGATEPERPAPAAAPADQPPAPPPSVADDGAAPPEPGEATATEGADAGASWWELNRPDLLDQILVPGPLAAGATAAGVLTALLWLLLGGIANVDLSAAAAALPPFVGDSRPENAPAAVPLIDPRTGRPFATDGDRFYWGGEAGWVDRQTALQWSEDVRQERRDRDQEVEANWSQWMNQRDADYIRREQALADAGYYFNEDAQAWLPATYAYDRERGMAVPPGAQWDADRQVYVDDSGATCQPVPPPLQNAYHLQDYIDDNLDTLPEGFRNHVVGQLGQIDLSDPYHISPEDCDRLWHTAHAVESTRIGQVVGNAAAAEVRDIDRGEVRMQAQSFVQNFAMLSTRFALSRLDPTQGVLTGAVFGYFSAPEGHGIRNALVSGAAAYLDVTTSAVNPGAVIRNMATGAVIGAGEQLFTGGSLEDMACGALMNGTMNGVFSLGHTPTVRNWLDGMPGTRASALDHAPGATGRPSAPAIASGLRGTQTAAPDVPVRPAAPAMDQTQALPPLRSRPPGPPAQVDGGTAGPRLAAVSGTDTSIPGAGTARGAVGAGVGTDTAAHPTAAGTSQVRSPTESQDTSVRVADGAGDGRAASAAAPAEVTTPPTWAAYDPLEAFQAETHVRVTGGSDAGPIFHEADQMDYARAHYGDRPPAEAMHQAEADLTRRFQHHRDEAAFQSQPPRYGVKGELQANHGLNNGVRDGYADWVTRRDPVQDLPVEESSPLPANRYNDDPEVTRAQIDADENGGLSRTFPPEHTLDWEPPPGQPHFPRTGPEWHDRDAVRGMHRDPPVYIEKLTPEVNDILVRHPELVPIDRSIREAYRGSFTGAHAPGADGAPWTQFQNELRRNVDFSAPENRELMARWTYYVLERRQGTPPWFRQGQPGG